MTDLEMLHIMVNANGLSAVDRKDFHAAKAIRERIEATTPKPQRHIPSTYVPESNQSFVDRLPDPEGSEMSRKEIEDRRQLLYGK